MIRFIYIYIHYKESTLLVGNLDDHDETRFLGYLMQSPFGNLDNLDNLGFYDFQTTEHKVLVECETDMKEIILNSSMVLLYDFTITSGYDPLPDGVCQFRKGDVGIFIPWGHNITKQHWVLDLFSGGYGGWKFGLDIVQQYLANFADELTYPKHCVIGIDSDLPSVTQSSINHSAILLPDQPIPNNFFADNVCDAIFHAPIQSHHWKQSVALIRPDWWTMSFPCQPWTTSAKSLGFGDSNGRALAYAIGLLRIFRPRLCLLENVKGFAEHKQFPLAVKLFGWAGYQFLHQGVFEASVHLPIKRPRFLAILGRIEDEQRPFQWKHWGDGFPTNPKAWDAFFPTTPDEAIPFTPSPDAKRMYLDPSMLPPGAPESFKNSMLAFRIPDPTKRLPTMMAAYGEHHMIPNYLLKQKGLQGYFTSEHGSFRWFQPIEMALMHLQTQPFVLLKPAKLAWHSIGNSIVTVHSVLAIANLFAHHFQDFDPSHVPAIIENIVKHHLRYRTVELYQDELAWYVGTQEQIQQSTNQVRFLSQQMGWTGSEPPIWPTGEFFHPSKGRMSIRRTNPNEQPIENIQAPMISPTLPFPEELLEEVHESHKVVNNEVSLQPTINDEVVTNDMIVDDGYSLPHDTTDAEAEMTTQDMIDFMQETLLPEDDNSQTQQVKISPQPASSESLYISPDHPRTMIAAIPGTYGELFVQPHTTWDQLLPLWDCKFLPSSYENFEESRYVQTSILVREEGFYRDWIITPHAFIDHSKQTSLLFFDEDQTWGEISQKHQLPDQLWFDDIGLLSANTKMLQSSRISGQMHSLQPFVDLYQCKASFNEVVIQSRIPSNTDVLVVHFEGSSEHLVQLASFWHIALSEEWCASHGRKRCFQALTATSCQFLFPPHGNKCSSPAIDFKTFITMRLMRAGIFSVSEVEHPNAILVQFKYHGRTFNPCYLPGDMTFEFFIQLFQHATSLNNFGDTPGLVVAGIRIGDIVTIQEVASTHQSVKCHVIDPLIGGGPSNGSKGQHRQAVSAALATMLIEEGLQLAKVSEAVKSLMDQMSLPSLTHMLFSESTATREQSFRLMCTNCDIVIPQKATKIAKTQAKFQKLARDEASRNNRNIDVSKYRIIPEFFRLADGSPAPINVAFSPCVSGVTMVNSQQASQWLVQKGKLAPDELALFIVGDIGVEEDDRLQRISIPAYNEQGDKVLIGGKLLQLGEKQITTISAEETTVQTLDVRVCSVTLWASDFTADQWKVAVEQPVKFAKKLLEHDQLHQAIKTPWGRSLRAGKLPAGQQTATSVQFHCEVRIKDLRPLLRRSGFNKVYVMPKDQDGKPDSAWRIIWTDMDINKLETVATPVAGTAGLVKGNRSHGLRVETAAFNNMWDILHPGRDPPDQMPKGSLWKATPMPIGLDKDIIQEWAKQHAWDCFPIKSLGSKTWLLQAPSAPPNELMCFNGTPIIIRKVPPKSSQPQTGILAGPRYTPSNEQESTSIFRQGDPFLDSWANWRPTTTPVSSAPASVSTKAESSAGPTASRLDLQDKKIQELQQAVQCIQNDTKQKNQDDDRRFTTIESQITRNHEQVQSSFQTLRTDFETTLHRAMSSQDQKIHNTMEEIKALFHRGSKRPQSRDRASEDEDGM